jgi:hypothetical protein
MHDAAWRMCKQCQLMAAVTGGAKIWHENICMAYISLWHSRQMYRICIIMSNIQRKLNVLRIFRRSNAKQRRLHAGEKKLLVMGGMYVFTRKSAT